MVNKLKGTIVAPVKAGKGIQQEGTEKALQPLTKEVPTDGGWERMYMWNSPVRRVFLRCTHRS